MNQEFFAAIRAGDAAKTIEMIDADPALLNATDDNGLSAYTVARYSRQNEIAQMLQDRGAEMDICAASMAGALDRVVELLADDRTRVGNYSNDGWTPLHLAAFFGHKEAAEALLSNGADVHARSRNAMENTALHAGAASRHIEVITVLLAHGADVNARQHGGWTALHAAAQNGDVEMASLLLAHGADREARADNNQTPLDLAMTRGHQAMSQQLDKGVEGTTA